MPARYCVHNPICASFVHFYCACTHVSPMLLLVYVKFNISISAAIFPTESENGKGWSEFIGSWEKSFFTVFAQAKSLCSIFEAKTRKCMIVSFSPFLFWNWAKMFFSFSHPALFRATHKWSIRRLIATGRSRGGSESDRGLYMLPPPTKFKLQCNNQQNRITELTEVTGS